MGRRKTGIFITFILLVSLLFGGCGKAEEALSKKTASQEAASADGVVVEKAGETAEQTDKAAEKTDERAGEEDETSGNAGGVTASGGKITLVMVGDILLHDPVTESGALEDGSYRYEHLFENVKAEIQGADLALVNQEVILGGRELGLSGYPNFNGPYEVGDALVDAGFDLVLHATNHALDKGKKGILNCVRFWRTSHPQIGVLGIYDNQADYDSNTYFYEQDGIKIAILNYTYGTNGIRVPSDMPYAVSYLQEEKVKADLERAEAQADFTIVCPHWGIEYEHAPSAEQKRWAELFLEGGADLVLGTHPHVIQPVEWMENESGERMLIYYSLGNFINATSGSGPKTADRMIGAMAELSIGRTADGRVEILDYGVQPLVTQLLYGKQEITTYKLADYTEELAQTNQILEKDSAFSLDYCKDLCSRVFGELYAE